MSYEVIKKKAGRGHAYYIDGEKVPRVTEIVKAITSKGGGFENWLQTNAIEGFQRLLISEPDSDFTTQHPRDILKWSKPKRTALDRGTEVHKAAETGDFDWRKYHPSAQNYIRALQRFHVEEGPQAEEMELVVGSKELGYAGTLDARGFIGESLILWDYKTATRPGTTPYVEYHLQLAAYELASCEMGYAPTERQTIVMLYPDGDYATFPVQATPDDWIVAMAWYQQLSGARERIAA